MNSLITNMYFKKLRDQGAFSKKFEGKHSYFLYLEEDKKKKENKEKKEKKDKKKITRNSKKHTRRNAKKSNKRISFKKSSISDKDIHRVETKIKEIRSKKTDEIKKELEDSGIKVSGKSKRLLKDIYLYSKICNINIQHEK